LCFLPQSHALTLPPHSQPYSQIKPNAQLPSGRYSQCR
jgi:hypothetical protein